MGKGKKGKKIAYDTGLAAALGDDRLSHSHCRRKKKGKKGKFERKKKKGRGSRSDLPLFSLPWIGRKNLRGKKEKKKEPPRPLGGEEKREKETGDIAPNRSLNCTPLSFQEGERERRGGRGETRLKGKEKKVSLSHFCILGEDVLTVLTHIRRGSQGRGGGGC